MKRLERINYCHETAEKELNRYIKLLQDNPEELKEREHILPFFAKNTHLASLFWQYSGIYSRCQPDLYASELQLGNDYKIDYVIGNEEKNHYILIEFENGEPNGIFKPKKRTNREWSNRLHAAYGQLTDWFQKISDMRSTDEFQNIFHKRDPKFTGLIVIGYNVNHSSEEKKRLKWRIDRTLIDSNHINIITFDEFSKEARDYLDSENIF